MLIRVSYDRPIEEVKAALRAKARPMSLDNYTKDSSDILYCLIGSLMILYPRRGALRLRFSGLLRPTKDGGTKLTGIYGITPLSVLIILPMLVMIGMIVVSYWREPFTALIYVLLVLLLPGGFFLLTLILLPRLTGENKDRIRSFLQTLVPSSSLQAGSRSPDSEYTQDPPHKLEKNP